MSNFTFYLISFLGALQGSMIGIIVFIRKAYLSNIFLASFIFIFSIGLLEPFLQTQLDEKNIFLLFLQFSNFLYGPLVFLFVTSLYKEVRGRNIFVHFSLFIAGFCTAMIMSWWQPENEPNIAFELISFEILVVQMLGYTIVGLKRLLGNAENILTQKKNFSKGDIDWLKYFLIALVSIYSLSFLVTHISLFGFSQFNGLHRFNQLLMMAAIYSVGYKILVKPDLFLFRKNGREMKSAVEKYSRSGLTETRAGEYLDLLERYMSGNKPFLNAGLSIHELAEQLGITKHHLTQLLNEKLGKNFYEYINYYRVEEVKIFMRDPGLQNLNLSALGLKSGFKSKTSFNINFRKFTGLPPSEWRKKYVDNDGCDGNKVV